ncbi:uncharacterized serine-rich protein C215.13-like [Tetranychus urticae]|uniref:Glycoprotein hormone subunit beta domain-containing protein n=1 Tax=Tetranychus urticae TaxID=32264 RepID=T1JQM8_TETUR|nr:uncharacterized serine-rich protein C215.13-like [Tetranychus urticae]
MMFSPFFPLLLTVLQLFETSTSSHSSPTKSSTSSLSTLPSVFAPTSSSSSRSIPSSSVAVSSLSLPSPSSPSSSLLSADRTFSRSKPPFTPLNPSVNKVNNNINSNRIQKTKLIDLRSTLECHRREFTFNASRSDGLGRKCWGLVTSMSCWGRCDSMEIADYKFPYKQSYHKVCIHNRKAIRTTLLPYCDRGVHQSLKIYKYVDAISCSCQFCDSSIASCEGFDAIERYLMRSSINEI